MTTIMSVIFTPIFITCYCLLSPLSAKYKLAQRDKAVNNKLYEFIDFLKDVVSYKETILLVVCIYKLITNTNTYLGSSYSAGISIALIILIFVFKIFEIQPPTSTTEIKMDDLTLPNLLPQPAITQGNPDVTFCQKIDKISKEQASFLSFFGGSEPVPGTIVQTTNQNGQIVKGGGVKLLKKIKHFNIKLV